MKNFKLTKKWLVGVSIMNKAQNSYFVDAGVMALIRAVPIIGDMIDTATKKAFNDLQEKKQKELIEIILSDFELITPNQVKNVEFIINFSKTVEAVKRLATNDKTKYFANLLKNGYLGETAIDSNDFEEYLNILNELSYREITYLVFLKQEADQKSVNYTTWSIFEKNFSSQFNIPLKEVNSIFRRLMRTGFIVEIFKTKSGVLNANAPSSLDVSSSGFEITESFNRFVVLITNNALDTNGIDLS